MPFAVAVMYFNEAKKYQIIRKIYITHHHIFTTIEPSKIDKLITIVLFVGFMVMTLFLGSLVW